jgi:eukaryotic-like serine/threonine-protein kinase
MKIKKQTFNYVGYKLTKKIACGGMGIVYKAQQTGEEGFNKIVAIKIIKENFSVIKEFRKNFIGEAQLVANLIHNNIVQTYHLGKANEQYFIVQEFVDGVNLEKFFLRHSKLNKPIPVDIAVYIVSRICCGLAYAHSQHNEDGHLLNIVHRDINPKNIMLSYEGEIKITDFGIAKALDLMYSKEGEVIAGKDEYLSPEQACYKVTDNRADLFACGVILAELILGRNIFEAEVSEKTRKNILKMRIPDFTNLHSAINGELNGILRKALARDRRRRYKTATDMQIALEQHLYSDGYRLTKEKFAQYMNNLFAKRKKHGKKTKPT